MPFGGVFRVEQVRTETPVAPFGRARANEGEKMPLPARHLRDAIELLRNPETLRENRTLSSMSVAFEESRASATEARTWQPITS